MERQNNMADFRRSKDDMLLGEMYSTLLLETPITHANIERFIKKYYLDPESGEPVTPEHNLREYKRCMPFARRYLNDWTPRLQQVIKAAGDHPISQINNNMNHYKSRQDDQLLQEAYNDIVEEKLGKIAASLAAAAALATGGSTGINRDTQSPPNRPVTSGEVQQDQSAHLVSAFNALLKKANPNEARQLQALWPQIQAGIKKGEAKP